MTTDRREFVHQVALGAATVAGLTALPARVAAALGVAPGLPAAEEWDTSWMKKVAGKHRAIFDIPEIESAYGIWRSQFWGMQMQEVFKAKPADLSTVIVLRHNGIELAMQQPYWDKYGVGKAHNATHPATQQATERNPALLASARGEIDAQFDALALPKVIERGSIVLGCNLAMEFFVVPKIAKVDGVSVEEARTRARGYLVPGVTLQPSGVFAALMAQEVGCKYIRAS
ncbi:MAG TPA: hypothetical protein VEA99_14050 [Gemmatimonadaceae bacterium]|nr:hypothetical protein [Gemmatimonadaceae bacterium]